MPCISGFALHKWHSNREELENDSAKSTSDEGPTYAKQQLGSNSSEAKLLDLPWDKNEDTLSVTVGKEKSASTKRSVLSTLAKIYDPLSIVSPTTLQGKIMYREICESNVAWDGELPKPLKKRWDNWSATLPEHFTISRTLAPYLQRIKEVTLHAFSDASNDGVSETVYEQEQGTTQGLVCARSSLAKRNLTIPRMELVSGHMAVNLATNVKTALTIHPPPIIHCWLDSSVALYWIKGQGEFRQFVSNRVSKIQQHREVKWHYVPTSENPADLGSRGGRVVSHTLWSQSPPLLSKAEKWPPDIILKASPETEKETRVTIKAHTDRTRFGNVTRIFSFQKQIKPSTDKNFTRYADQIAKIEN